MAQVGLERGWEELEWEVWAAGAATVQVALAMASVLAVWCRKCSWQLLPEDRNVRRVRSWQHSDNFQHSMLDHSSHCRHTAPTALRSR